MLAEVMTMGSWIALAVCAGCIGTALIISKLKG